MATPIQDNLLREIDEDLRHERYAKLWKRYGGFVIGAAVALVVGVAGYQAWRSYDIKSARPTVNGSPKPSRGWRRGGSTRPGSRFRRWLRTPRRAMRCWPDSNMRRFSTGREIGRRPPPLTAPSPTIRGVDREYRDFALVMIALAGLDTADPTTLSERLAPLTAEDNPWRHSAHEVNALLAARRGDRSGAREIFSRIENDLTAPAGVRNRATEMLAILGG